MMAQTPSRHLLALSALACALLPPLPGASPLQCRAVSFDSAGMDYDLLEQGPPPTALAYDGKAWPHMVVPGPGPTHIFAIGDWGGMDGGFLPSEEDRGRIYMYEGGDKGGPHPFPRSRWNAAHSRCLCTTPEMQKCFDSSGGDCNPECGWRGGVDTQPQRLVSNAFNQRVTWKEPKYVLNVGDNFYWGGIEKTCGTTPMTELSFEAQHQFDAVFNGIYTGSMPWLSVLGNHDYGGWRFDNAWDQQIAYTWKNSRWVMPASYWMLTVQYPDQGFEIDIFLLDSNQEDAKDPEKESGHNMCSSEHNPANASCAVADGPASVAECKAWFHGRWQVQQRWLEKRLAASAADWQIVVTHYPCGADATWYTEMHQRLGLDLLVTGHRHCQELWDPARLGGLTCFVTGGGGGITSEADPLDKRDWYGEAQYGFFDLTIAKEQILLESINWDGKVVKTASVRPKSMNLGFHPKSSNSTNGTNGTKHSNRTKSSKRKSSAHHVHPKSSNSSKSTKSSKAAKGSNKTKGSNTSGSLVDEVA